MARQKRTRPTDTVTAQRLARAVVAALILATALAVTADPAAAATSYVVKPGDTLSVIARDHGVTTTELADANGISNRHLIKVGQVLTIPNAEPQFHTVVAGDSVGKIAQIYGVRSADIVSLNSLADPNRIRIGQKLQLPEGAVAGPTSDIGSVTSRYPNLPSRIVDNPERLALVPAFERWGAHYGVPADLVMAVAYQESGWQAAVVSNKGAIGIGQLLPATAAWVASDLIGLPNLDPYNPDENIRMSTRFLLWLIGYLGTEADALAGYYQGPTSLMIRGPYDDTVAYVANIEASRWRFQQG